jgi:hypothetical protein
MKWIDITKKLPEKDDECLVITEQAMFDPKGNCVGYSEKKIELAYFHSKAPNGCRFKKCKRVLYWMKVPKIPA